MKRLFKSLYFLVIVAIVMGIVIEYFWPSLGTQLKPLVDAFIRLIKMMIAPVIFCTIVTGMAGMQDLKKVGRVGIKAVVYFEVVSTFAWLIGLISINILRPGAGMHVDPASLDASAIT